MSTAIPPNVKSYLDKLTSNEGYDYAVIQFKSRAPMAIERAVCKSSRVDDCITLEVANGPHPILEGKTAMSTHFLPVEEIIGITYYSESRIVPMGKMGKA